MLRRRSTGMHMHIRDGVEYWVAFLVQGTPTGGGITGEHWPVAAPARPLHRFLRIGLQIDDFAALRDILLQIASDGLGHGRSPAERDDTTGRAQQIGDDLRFQLTELRLAVLAEILSDTHASTMLDHLVRISEPNSQHLRDFAAHTRFSGSGHADEHCHRRLG